MGTRVKMGVVSRKAEQVVGLARQDATILASYGITGEVLTNLESVVAQLRELEAAQHARRIRMRESTERQDQAMSEIVQFAGDVRRTVKRGAPHDKDLHRAVGVGRTMHHKVADARAAIQIIVDAFRAQADRLVDAGVPAAAAQRASALLIKLVEADTAQERRKAHLKNTTSAKDEAVRATITGMNRVAAAALLAWADNPERRALYLAAARWQQGGKTNASDGPKAGDQAKTTVVPLREESTAA